MGHLEGNFTPVLYIGRKVSLRLTFCTCPLNCYGICRLSANSPHNRSIRMNISTKNHTITFCTDRIKTMERTLR